MLGYFCIIIFSFFILEGCTYHVAKNSGLSPDSGAFSDQATIDALLIQQSVLNTCVRCHGGTQLPSLSSIDGIQANIGKVQSEVNLSQMPPSDSGYSALSDCQKAILQEWVFEGMPAKSDKKVLELSACKQGGLNTPAAKSILEMPLNYQTLTTQILQPKCLHCHNINSSDTDASIISIFPYAQLIARKDLLGVDSSHSKFVNLVTRADDDRMPPPEDSQPLAEDQQQFIRNWIDAGHSE